eukprot:scaffold14717_cov168-Ochromonas_danica.AAC.13
MNLVVLVVVVVTMGTILLVSRSDSIPSREIRSKTRLVVITRQGQRQYQMIRIQWNGLAWWNKRGRNVL